MTYVATQKTSTSAASPIAIPNLLKRAALRMVEYTHRQRFWRDTENLSERRLRDVGLTRDDIDMTRHMSLAADADKELQRISKSRARNW